MKSEKVLFFLVLFYPILLFAQTRTGWGGDAAMYANYDYGTFMGHASITHNWQLNKSFSVSLGAKFLYARIDELSGWKTPDAHYSFDDEAIMRINALVAATFTLPIVKNTGIYLSPSVFAEPIPLSYISIKKSVSPLDYTSEGKYAYTKFAPGVFMDVGIYHTIRKEDNSMKLFLGVGYGWHDPLPEYRSARINGQDLSTKIPDKKDMYRVMIRIMFY